MTSGHEDNAPAGAYLLGTLLAKQGDVDCARAVYQQAIESGHHDKRPKAAVSLGILLADQGDAEGARAAYQLAISSGHPTAGPDAAVRTRLLPKDRNAWPEPVLREAGSPRGGMAPPRQARAGVGAATRRPGKPPARLTDQHQRGGRRTAAHHDCGTRPRTGAGPACKFREARMLLAGLAIPATVAPRSARRTASVRPAPGRRHQAGIGD